MIDTINHHPATSRQSNNFQNKSSYNILLDAALPMLGMVTKLVKLPSAPDNLRLKQLLIQQMDLFVGKISQASYDEQIIIAARSVMCACVDDILLDAIWKTPLTWEQDSLSQHFMGSAPEGKKFFIILKRAYEEECPDSANIDLLELLYVCLNLGFLGKYRASKKGGQLIKAIKNKLYEQITRQRKNMIESKKLAVTAVPVFQEKNFDNSGVVKQGTTKILSQKMWIILSLIALSSVVVYITFDLRLAYLAQVLVEKI